MIGTIKILMVAFFTFLVWYITGATISLILGLEYSQVMSDYSSYLWVGAFIGFVFGVYNFFIRKKEESVVDEIEPFEIIIACNLSTQAKRFLVYGEALKEGEERITIDVDENGDISLL
jgi:hypothetical protein